MCLAWLIGRFWEIAPEAHVIKSLFSICYAERLGSQKGCMINDYDPAHRIVRESCVFVRRKVVPNTITAAVASQESIAKTV